MAKKPKFKLGDRVTVKDKPFKIFKIVYYKDNDATCGVADGSTRYIEKVKNLTLIMRGDNDEQSSDCGEDSSDV